MRCGKSVCPATVAIFIICYVIAVTYGADKPCAARKKSDSVECVCNSTYCDEITRSTPSKGKFHVYTTTKSGQRFSKKTDNLRYYWQPFSRTSTLVLDLNEPKQTVEGFGGGVSDISAALWVNLTDPQLKKHLINSFFGSSGIEFNMLRLPIGSTDFSPSFYSYQDRPEHDPSLSNFNLTKQDYKYKIPMIKAANATSTAPLHIVATMWGPPLWMKTKREVSGVARLQDKYYGPLAKYHHKFLEHYAAEGIKMWALTTPNEPLSGIMSLSENARITWTVQGLGKWMAEHLGPTIRNSTFKDLKLIIGEDMRMTTGMWFTLTALEVPKILDYVDGIGVHFYFDKFTPADMLTVPLKGYEDKFVLYTESSLQLKLGSSWDKAEQYTRNIIQDLNYNVTGFIDWNLCLDPEGGPAWSKIQLEAPIFIDLAKKEFAKQPLFYALGHFAKFIPRGSRRITKIEDFPCGSDVDNVSFLTPNNTLVTVLYNRHKENHRIQIGTGFTSALVDLEPESITTVEFPYLE